MGKNALGQTTIPVIAHRRMSYHEQLVVPGQRFECDEVQAQAWLKRGLVSLLAIQERPKFVSKPVDPVVAKVLAAEKAPEPKPAPQPVIADPAAKVEEQAATAADTTVEPVSTAAVTPPERPGFRSGRYDRRDMRSKP